jgi:opacity protein-like surface antigen
MILRFAHSILAAAAIAALVPLQAQAADVALDEPASDWTFTGAAYLWGAGISGQSGVFGLEPQEVDLSFSDLLKDLDFAFMGLGEARNGRFVMGMDLTYTNVGSTVDNPRGEGDERFLDSIDVDTTSWMVTGYAGYSILDNDEFHVDLIGGARYWSVNTDFKLNTTNPGPLDGRTFDDGASWIDPLAGVKMRFDLTDDVFVSSWGMIGGFGVGSDLMWDVMAGAGYSFTEHFDVFAGYRAVSVDYSDDGFVYDMVQQGPVMAGVFRF